MNLKLVSILMLGLVVGLLIGLNYDKIAPSADGAYAQLVVNAPGAVYVNCVAGLDKRGFNADGLGTWAGGVTPCGYYTLPRYSYTGTVSICAQTKTHYWGTTAYIQRGQISTVTVKPPAVPQAALSDARPGCTRYNQYQP